MTTKILQKLGQDYTELLENKEYCDVTINVGKDHNTKIFHAHRNILNIPYCFEWNYYIGRTNVLNILVAADELLLQDLVDYIQEYLINNKSIWMKQHFELIHRTSFQSNYLLELQQFCTNFMVQFPKKTFKSLDFNMISEKSLVSLIKRDDLQMKEIEIWEHVLKWGLAQNSNLVEDPDTWLDDGLKSMKITLQNCLPSIRFYNLSSKEFLHKVRPYKKLLNQQLYKDLLNSYMDPDVKPNDNILPSRNLKIDGIIDSTIVNLNIVSLISRWIDKVDVNINFAQFRELYLPYKFRLLLRGSRDGFTPKRFHELCDDKPCTITFIKIKGTGEIIGGYNPTVWLASGGWGKIKDSFIFSFRNKQEFYKDPILSKVKDFNYALNRLLERHGPFFGGDILIYSENSRTNYSTSYCQQTFYEKKIRNTKNNFSMEDYEVYQLINR
ncbi:hypothetical protein RclHR1_04460008 [Rhizophagus clarus]|uniref:TLDc domain-containing protein n=1 Tax=Rhizophagus clarus TaxID=94130 RepID=A0A2Z6RH86_9GLOM|nr:hypothetical protein RclHR1_04460008 [Rhizophagus clarus]